MRSTRLTRQPVATVTIIVALLCSCSKKQDQNLIPAKAPTAESIRFQYAVYLLSKPGQNPSVVLRAALARKFSDLKLVDEIPKDPKAMLIHAHMQKDVQREYAPPNVKSLQYFGRGITSEQSQALQKSNEAFILEFAHPKEHVWTALRAASALVEEIARQTGGLVWDEETREIFSPDAWHKKRLASWTTDVPDVSSQTVIHAYNNGEYARAITLGMSKLGLPDVVIEEFPWSSNDRVGNLINIFCQSMAEGADFRRPERFKLDLRAIKNSAVRDDQVKSFKSNAAGVACLTLKQGKWEDGDPENRLIQLASDAYPGNDIHAKQDKMLASLFGWEDSVAMVKNNPELLAASDKARAKLPDLRKAFLAGLEPGEFIEVKAPFETPDGETEWMWVEVNSWRDDKIKGLLENEPFKISSLHAGQIVDVRQEDVFDYIRQYPDKRREGNSTGDILRKMDEQTSRRSNHAAEKAITPCAAD